MKKLSLLFILSIISIISFAQKKEKIKGDKNVVTTTDNISKEFNAIEVADELKVTLTQGIQNSYTLSSDKNLQEVIQFTVVEGTLKIYTTSRITSSKKLEIKVTFKNLEQIKLKDDAEIDAEKMFESKVFIINADNSSKFNLEIKTKDISITMLGNAKGKLKANSESAVIAMSDKSNLNADISTDRTTVELTKSAKVELDGKSDDATFTTKDSSELDAKRMKTSSVSLNTSNNAKVHIDVKKNLQIYAKDKSNIYLYSEPKIQIEKFADKAELLKR